MNREIKFRAWDEDNEIMHFDFQFFTSGDDVNDWICFSSDKEPRDTKTVQHGIVFSNPYFRQQFKIMQFTGLLDKNGNQIYEGDVVKWLGYEVANNRQMRPGRWIVVGQGYISPKIEQSNFINDCYYLQNLILQGDKSIEIIGNIHENPELLEGLK